MANIKRIEGKTGTSYKITVSHGRDSKGRQMRYYLTWTPPQAMTQRQVDKEIVRVSMDFETKIKDGFAIDNRQTFTEYAEYVIDLKERTGAKHRTIELYRSLLKRIDSAIGHIKVSDIRPAHLNTFYANLAEKSVRIDSSKAYSTSLAIIVKSKKLSHAKLAVLSGISETTVATAIHGSRITLVKATAISQAINKTVDELFTIEKNLEPLSNKTITEYHRLISTILSQAEKEMIVLYNAASKATPPKVAHREAETFQPEEIIAIRDALDREPIKWKTATHLLLITGCRRGEIMGLKWSKVDWDNNQIKIDCALLYSSTRGIYEDTTKTNATRYIKLPIETMELLREYRTYYNELRLLNNLNWNDTDYLFIRDNGLPSTPDSITNWLNRFAKRHSLNKVYPHKFRHTMASLLYFGGIDAVAISKRLGHAKVSTTTDIYSHIIKEADERASECIADTILRTTAKVLG